MRCVALSLVFVAAVFLGRLHAEETAKSGKKLELSEGRVTLAAPAGWESKQPATRIVQYEFVVPAVDGDDRPGRVTIMGAGGSVKANVDRWIGQFSQPDGKATRERTTIEELQVAGTPVTLVDITGTFRDFRGPFAPAKQYPESRMLGAIISTDGLGQYFVKFAGPKKTVAENEKAFRTMLKSLKLKGK